MNSAAQAIAIVGVGAILPDAPSAAAYWENIINKRYSISDVPGDRWSADLYYDPDPKAPDKTYSKIGGWVRGFEFDWRRFRMPPKVAGAMDEGQQWAVTIAADALADYGYPERPLNTERTGVIIGTAMGGERTYTTNQRIVMPEYVRWLQQTAAFSSLPGSTQDALLNEWQAVMSAEVPEITEDSMPGELPNIISGRIANILDMRGPNFITDAACASSFAAIEAAMELLIEHKVDAVLSGGVDRNMGIGTFVKFCKIGALSATGTRPFGAGADGFVMGEGAGAFLLKRLEDAEQANDTIYAVIRGVGGSSDGKGKGITAPNPAGQQLAIRRAWENAGLDPATATLIEAHGTSTRVGDVVEVESLAEVFGHAATGSIGIGSAKSNIGHLKAGAGAAGLMKATLALHHRVLPPTLNAEPPNPNIDFPRTPFYAVDEAREWTRVNGTPRRCGVSAYGFGGTNFHLVLEEYEPGLIPREKRLYSGASVDDGRTPETGSQRESSDNRPLPPRGIFALSAAAPEQLQSKLEETIVRVEAGWMPPRALPATADIVATERLVIDFGDREELLDRLHKSLKVMGFDTPQAWKALEAQGIFRGHDRPAGKLAFLFPGQGSQYVNMGRELAEVAPIVRETIEEADRTMTPILGRPLSSYIFVDASDSEAMQQAQFDLMQTEITQPAMLTLDEAIRRLLAEYGFGPDMVMGHSLGEYGALVAAGIMPFAQALEAAAGRGREMARVEMDDNGWMAAVLAPYDVVEQTLKGINGYVVPANINSRSQSVIGGASKAVEAAIARFQEAGYQAMQLPVSHAFHTNIVAPASKPLRDMLDRMDIQPPILPIVANVTGEIYPTEPTAIKDLLEQQIASPVQWVKGLETLYNHGVRTFVEVGPKRALRGFVKDVFTEAEDVVALLTNHPKTGELPAFNQALCGLYAAGYGAPAPIETRQSPALATMASPQSRVTPATENKVQTQSTAFQTPENGAPLELNAAFADAVQQLARLGQNQPYDRNTPPLGSVVISGTGLGLPGAEKATMDPDNALRILQGEQFVDLIPERFRQLMIDKRITRLVKGEDGSGRFETIDDTDDAIKLAGRPGTFDLAEEYGVPDQLVEALDVTTQLAMAAGLDALREAGIPLVQTFKHTSTGKHLPDRWMLPEALRDDTGVIFASAFPGGDRFAEEFKNYYSYRNRVEQLEMLEELRNYATDPTTASEINRRVGALRDQLEREPYVFDRRFLFRILSMGHSQFAQYIGARGPNTQVNAACASTAQGIALAEDWIRSGRCRRVVVLGADDVTGDNLLEWVGAGFLAVGAVTTKDRVAEAALPFDRRRHGTILGMGACALVVESQDAVSERGMRGIVELLSSETSNSAFHGTRLDVHHISMVMESLVSAAERRFGLNRLAMAPQTVFVSHETFTPARGGSAAAEVVALRQTFGDATNEIVMANTKGFTGHPMGVGVEDVIAVKILEYGIVPPVPNFKEIDPELGPLNLSRGGRYPVQYAIHLAAGFGSQIALTLTRRIPGNLNRIDSPPRYQQWLDAVSGYDRAETEVIKRVLRVKSNGNPPHSPAANVWQPGTGPVVRTPVSPAAVTNGHPARMVMPDAAPVAETPAVMPAPPQPAAATPASDDSAVVEAMPATPEPAPPKAASEQETLAEETPVIVEPVVPAAVELTTDPIVSRVIALVAEQTGYPSDMLDPDLDLEADLGIDTVKQAETFAAIRKAFEIPRRDDLSLRDYPTLEAVIGFVREMRPDLVADAPEPVTAQSGPTTDSVATSAPTSDAIVHQVLAIVAAQTGYPEDMLDLDLDLEADLGIDTVKQAETFAAIRKAFEIPRRDDLSLRDYPTLEAVIGFVRQMRPDLTAPPAVEPTPAPQSAPQVPATPPGTETSDAVTSQVLAIVAEQTGYPQDMLDLDLDMEADLGIDTVKQAETFAAIRQAFDIPRRDDLSLRDYPTLEAVISFVREMRPDLKATDPIPAAPATSAAPVSTVSTPQAAVEVAPVIATRAVDEIASTVLSIVAELTGYPEDMLEMDLDLEADLGIDTVKQAETFLAIREAFDIPRRDDLNLRDYATLEAVIGFVRESRPDLVGAYEVAGTPPEPAMGTHEVDGVMAQVLAIVSEQTGYPQDMLELDLDLEADLGIDTVKQAETFLAIREAFDIPRRDDLNLRDYATLAAVVGFVYTMRPDLKESPATPSISTDTPQTTASSATTGAMVPGSLSAYRLEDADTMPRRVPTPTLRPALEFCKATGVVLDETSRVVVMLDRSGIGKALVSRLEKIGVTALVIEPQIEPDALMKQIANWQTGGPIQGVYWLPALDEEPELADMDLNLWRAHNQIRVKNLYATMRMLYDTISTPNSFLVSATRFGGLHGYGPEGATAPMGGSVSGFTKAYKRERPEALVKVVDFAPGRKTAAPADALIAETLSDPSIVEVGYLEDQRYGITLVERPAANGEDGLDLNSESVFLVTGAAGGITSAIIGDLAANSGGTFYLLDLTPEPDRNDPRIGLFRTDLDALKAMLIAEAKSAGEKPTPVLIDKRVMAIERSEAALRAIEAVEATGGTVHYRSVNLLDGPELSAIVDEIRSAEGRIDVLVHAGGIEISRSLEDKPPEQFDLVFDIKADGFFSLLRAASDMSIGATVAFSSVAGRFGNNGQTDYSAANDLLCKLTSSLRRWRPETRGIAIDWTAWGEIGMATRGSIPRIMEMAGIDMLPPTAGVPTVRRELVAGSFSGEIVAAGALGMLVDEWDETGGLDIEHANEWLAAEHGDLLMVGKITGAPLYGGITAETTLDPTEQPFLFDHAMDGTPLLPGVMGTEAFAEVALVAAPGLSVQSVHDEQFHSPFKFYRMEPQVLYLSAQPVVSTDGQLEILTALRSRRELGKPGLPPQEKLHFTAEVSLGASPPSTDSIVFTAPDAGAMSIDAAAIYEIYFHGPAYQVLESASVEGDEAIGLLASNLPPNTSPAEAAGVMAPRLIELCFQAAGVWEIRTNGTMALPLAIASVSTYRQGEPTGNERLYALVSAHDGGERYDAHVVDQNGRVYVSLTGYRTVALPGEVSL